MRSGVRVPTMTREEGSKSRLIVQAEAEEGIDDDQTRSIIMPRLRDYLDVPS